jgi:CelD/BcsL family acetyltransferase involved in cellulose biosynthesis
MRWRMKNQTGVLDFPSVREFHNRASGELARRGYARFFGLRWRDSLIAILFTFVRGPVFYYYLGGFAPNLARYGPGSLVLEYACGEAARAGATEFDFLRGAEKYKYDWGARDKVNRSLTLE